jgi:CRISPR/Cas system-associated exonuclease Cas4 (RecB family)
MKKQLLTHSLMQTFKTCRKKAWFAYEVGLRREVDAKALRMGSAGHAALDELQTSGSLDTAILGVQQFYRDCPDGVEQYDWAIERETVECLITGYHWRWNDQPLEIVDSEKAFELRLKNPASGRSTPAWDVGGKIDGIVSLDQRQLVLEHKFVSEDIGQDSDYWRRLQLDSQISLYTWAARESGYSGVSGVLYDAIRKPTIKPSQIPILDADGLKIVLDEAGERVFSAVKPHKPRQAGDAKKGWVLQTRPMAPDEWADKLLGDIGERPEWYFARIEIARLDDDIEEMRDEIWEIQHVIKNAQQQDRWYKTVSRDTCGFCSYFGLCGSKWRDNGDVPDGFVKVDDVHPELT